MAAQEPSGSTDGSPACRRKLMESQLLRNFTSTAVVKILLDDVFTDELDEPAELQISLDQTDQIYVLKAKVALVLSHMWANRKRATAVDRLAPPIDPDRIALESDTGILSSKALFRQVSRCKSHAASLTPQVSRRKSHAASLTPQVSRRKSDAASLTPHSPHLSLRPPPSHASPPLACLQFHEQRQHHRRQ